MGWAHELAQSSFFQQKEYLTQEVRDERLDFEEYLEVKENVNSTYEEIKSKEKDTLKKVSYYAKERNVSMIDTAIKTLMFWKWFLCKFYASIALHIKVSIQPINIIHTQGLGWSCLKRTCWISFPAIIIDPK